MKVEFNTDSQFNTMFLECVGKNNNFHKYKEYKRIINFLHPTVIVEKYNKNHNYREKLRWLRTFERKTTTLIFPFNLNECKPLDTIVWNRTIATSVGYTEQSIITYNCRCFKNLNVILDVPINWWRPLYDYQNRFFDKWNHVMSDLSLFEDELVRKLDYIIFTTGNGEKFFILYSELHYNHRKFFVILACFQGQRSGLSNIWTHFVPIFSFMEKSPEILIARLKQIFMIQVKYSKVFAVVTNSSYPTYLEDETAYLFGDLVELRNVLNISFDEALFILPPQFKPDVFFIDFKVSIIYNPSILSIDDFVFFLKYNNIDYEITTTKECKFLMIKKGIGKFSNDAKILKPSNMIETLMS